MSFANLVSALRQCKQGQGDLESVPSMFWLPETWGHAFFLEMTRFHWTAIRHMPVEEITFDIAEEAVRQHSDALMFLPYEYRTRDIYQNAINHIDKSMEIGRVKNLLSLIPEELFEELLIDWIEHGNYFSFSMIPSHRLSNQFTVEAVRSRPLLIEEVPNERHTPEMLVAFLAGGNEDHYLEDVKQESRSRALCISCLREGRGPSSAVPASLWDDEMREIIGKVGDKY